MSEANLISRRVLPLRYEISLLQIIKLADSKFLQFANPPNPWFNFAGNNLAISLYNKITP